MASVTKYIIAEQVESRLLGEPKASSKITQPEIMKAIEGAINKLLKIEYLNVDLGARQASGSSDIIGEYENIVVKEGYGTSYIELPVFPVKLLMGQGVWKVFDPKCPGKLFIPIPSQHFEMFYADSNMADLLSGHVGYHWVKLQLRFTRNILKDGIDKLSAQLKIMDIAAYSDYEALPVPADMIFDIVAMTVELLTGQPVPDKRVDTSTEITQR